LSLGSLVRIGHGCLVCNQLSLNFSLSSLFFSFLPVFLSLLLVYFSLFLFFLHFFFGFIDSSKLFSVWEPFGHFDFDGTVQFQLLWLGAASFDSFGAAIDTGLGVRHTFWFLEIIIVALIIRSFGSFSVPACFTL